MKFKTASGPTMQERDEELEKSYSFHRSTPFESLTAHVSVNRDSICFDFFDWSAKQPFQESLEHMLIRFEEYRFGRALEPAAHGMLFFTVKHRNDHMRSPDDALFTSEVQRDIIEAAVLATTPIDGEGIESRLTRIGVAAGLVLPEKPRMTLVRDVRMPYKDSEPTQTPTKQEIPELEPFDMDDLETEAGLDWSDADA